MTISYLQDSNSNIMTMQQFERLNQEKLIGWLIHDQHCSFSLAKRVRTKIMEHLNLEFKEKKIQKESVIWEAFYSQAAIEILKLQKQMDKNFGLTEEAFDQMLDAFSRNDNSLFEQVFLKHFKYCMSYLQKNYKASEEDAYDASMETLLVFSKRLKSGKIKYGNLRFLFTKMAGQIYLKWIKKENLKESLEGIEIEEEKETLDPENLKILNKAWEQLGEPCQMLLKSFYYDRVPLNKISEMTGRKPAAIRKQKQRCIEKLRQLFIQFS